LDVLQFKHGKSIKVKYFFMSPATETQIELYLRRTLQVSEHCPAILMQVFNSLHNLFKNL